MSEDPWKAFDELKDYPGKKPPLRRENKEEEESYEYDGWDKKPVVYNVDGQAKEFFTIRHLAAALNRSPVTIRSWENSGKLPKSPYRSPAPKKSSIQSKPKGKRLWTRAQIEGLLSVAKETGCIVDDKQSPPNKEFTAKATRLFVDLLQKDNQ